MMRWVRGVKGSQTGLYGVLLGFQCYVTISLINTGGPLMWHQGCLVRRKGEQAQTPELGLGSRAWATQSLGCLQRCKTPQHRVVLWVWQLAPVMGSAFACFVPFSANPCLNLCRPSGWTLALSKSCQQDISVSLGTCDAKCQPLSVL